MSDFIRDAAADSVRVLSADRDRLAGQLRGAGATVTVGTASTDGVPLYGTDLSSKQIGTVASNSAIVLWELAPQTGSLEDAYLALTRLSLDYHDGEVA